MQRFVFSDLISPFHVASALVAARRCARGPAQVELRQIRNANGEFLLPEGTWQFDGLTVGVQRCDRSRTMLCATLFKLICLLLVRVVPLRKRSSAKTVWLGHHTYFKPTMLASVRLRDLPVTRVVTFEEGVGTYGDMAHHVQASRTINIRFPRTKYVLRRVLSQRLFVDVASNVMTNPAANQELMAVVNWMVNNVYDSSLGAGISLLETDSGQRRTLVAGSPLYSLGKISRDEYRAVLLGVLSGVSGSVWAKPHPLEKDLALYEEMGVKCISRELPGEAVVAALAPVTVIGFGTGLLKTSQYIPGVSCVDALSSMPLRVQDVCLPSVESPPAGPDVRSENLE